MFCRLKGGISENSPPQTIRKSQTTLAPRNGKGLQRALHKGMPNGKKA